MDGNITGTNGRGAAVLAAVAAVVLVLECNILLLAVARDDGFISTRALAVRCEAQEEAEAEGRRANSEELRAELERALSIETD